MMTDPRLLDIHQVAALLAHSKTWFQRNRAKLEKDGFPPRVPGMGARWDREAIEAWFARRIPPLETIEIAPPDDLLLARAQHLARRVA